MQRIAEWSFLAACRVAEAEAMFVASAQQNRAKRICRGCPVQLECLAEALDNRIDAGVWGGMTERERRTLLRRNPGVSDWWTAIGSAQRWHHDRTAPDR